MTFIVRCVLLFCVLPAVVSLCSATTRHSTQELSVTPVPDTVYSLERVYALAGKAEEPVWQILDSVDRREAADGYRNVPSYKIGIARAFVASRELNPRRAIRYLRPLLASNELAASSRDHLFAMALMCNECEVLGRTDERIEYTLAYLDLARRSGDSVRYSCAQLYMALAYEAQGAFSKAFTFLKWAQTRLRKSDDARALSYLLWSEEIEQNLYAAQKNYPEAIRRNLQLIARYKAFTPEERTRAGVGKETEMNFRQAQNHISLARLYALNGQLLPAREHYATAQSLLALSPQIISPQLQALTFDYLQAAGRYGEALECARGSLRETSIGDTVTRHRWEAVKRMAEASRLLGDYRQAWFYERQGAELADSLYERSNHEAALELQTIYETSLQQTQIQYQRVTIERGRQVVLLLSTVLLSLAVLLFILWHSRRKIARKNSKLFDQISSLSQTRRELERIRGVLTGQKSKRTLPETDTLFDNLEQFMHDCEGFRNPDLNRDQVAAKLGTNKLYLSNAIAEHRSMTFLEYLTQCRLEYAKDELLNDPATKIEAIALQSGFNSVRTFYRLFQKHYQLTPSEFRRLSELHKASDN